MRFAARIMVTGLSCLVFVLFVLLKPWQQASTAADNPDVALMGDLWDQVGIPRFDVAGDRDKGDAGNEQEGTEEATKGEGTVELPENELEKTEAQQLPQQNQQTADKQDNNLHTNENEGKQAENVDHPKHGLTPENPIRLSVVACGDRAGETLVLLKSAVIFSHRYLFFHLFAEDNVKIELSRELDTWPAVMDGRIRYQLYSIVFPEGQDAEQWKKIFKPCATQRLFLPDILKDIDSLIYVDTDILFLTPIETLWEHFYRFNASHSAALAPEGEDIPTGWYNRFARHPYYGVLGVNSGIMLMNLTRLRAMNWVSEVLKYYEEYRYKITWGDQDLINVIFHFHPDKLYVYPCEWNFRPDHCRYKNACPGAFNRIYMLHGNRQLFHKKDQRGMDGFITIYNTLEKHREGEDIHTSILEPLRQALPSYKADNTCNEMVSSMLASIEDTIHSMA